MQAVADSQGTLMHVQGELITQAYFDSLASEVDEVLQVDIPPSAILRGRA